MSARLVGCVLLSIGCLLLALLFTLLFPPVGTAAPAHNRLPLLSSALTPPVAPPVAPPVTASDPISVYLPFVSRGPDLLVAIDLGTLGGAESVARDVNSSGQVVGSSTIPGEQGETHACLWEDGHMRDLGTLGGGFSEARAINKVGRIVGVSEITGSADLRAFYWSEGHLDSLSAPGGRGSWAADINERSQIIGGFMTAMYDPHCFLWDDGEMIDLGTLGGAACFVTDINDRGQIVGFSTTATSGYRAHAFLWEAGRMTDLTPTLPPDQESRATVINERGQVGGYSVGTTGACKGECAFLWENGVITDLNAGGKGLSSVDSINEQGQAVGFGNYRYVVESDNYVWDAMRWEDGVFTTLGVQRSGYYGTTGLQINEAGQIVVANGLHAYLWQNGELIQLVAPDTDNVHASAIDDTGHVVGYARYGHALLWNVPAAER